MHVDLVADLRDRIAAKQIVCLAGAGVAAACARKKPGSECALWPQLLESGVRWVAGVHPELPAGWVDDRRRALASGDVDDLLAVASQVASKLGAPDGGEYAEWLHRTVGALELGDAALIAALGALDVPIFTTNYDHLIEAALDRDAISWRSEAAVDRVLRGDSNAILHLHGHYSEPESVVLGFWEYAGLVENEHTQAVMRALAMAKSILFVGFGAGLRDPNFNQFLRWSRRVSRTQPYRHYRLVRASETESARRDHDPDQRIMVLSYGEEHAELVPFLRALAPRRDPSVPVLLEIEKTSSMEVAAAPADDEAPLDRPQPGERYDELEHLEHELDQRLVGEFTLLEVLKKSAVQHADWSKRSARYLMNTVRRCAADLVNDAELEDVYWWLLVYGVLRFQGIERWWGRRRDWQHSVDLAEISPRGKHLLNAISAGSIGSH
jgi:hypothetical protein